MPQHPEAHIRRAVRVLSMVGELHKQGYQRLRVMPYMAPSGLAWRCTIAAADLFYRNHGAILKQFGAFDDDNQASADIARYTSGQDNHYFDWADAEQDNARSLADKFVRRFQKLSDQGKGFDYGYSGWYLRLLGLAEAGWLPIVSADCVPVVYDRVPLSDFRPEKGELEAREEPILPLPPPGELKQDYIA
jgi:hypothetical protein